MSDEAKEADQPASLAERTLLDKAESIEAFVKIDLRDAARMEYEVQEIRGRARLRTLDAQKLRAAALTLNRDKKE